MIFPFQQTQVSQSTITTPPISKTQTVSKKSFLHHCIIHVGSRSNCVHVTRQTVNTAKHHTRASMISCLSKPSMVIAMFLKMVRMLLLGDGVVMAVQCLFEICNYAENVTSN